MKPYKMIIFDWDGTLMDSAQKIINSLQYAAKANGLPVLEEDQYRYIIGLGVHEALEHLYPNQTLDVPAVIEAYQTYFYQHHLVPSPLFKGVIGLLDALVEKGYWLSIATGKSRAGLDQVLAEHELAHYFQITRTADETQSKPHPQMLNEIMEEMGLMPNECLMVGDTEFDLNMANNANMDAVGVTCGAHSKVMLEASKPVKILDYTIHLYDYLITP